MPERDGYLPGVPCWADTTQPDPQSALAFYSGLFGWDFEDVTPAGSPASYFIARLRGGDVAAVGPQPAGGPPMALWNTYVAVDNADEAAAKVLKAGGRVAMGPADVGDAGRMAVFTDPAGAAFSVWQAQAHHGSRIVNEAGSVSFNTLNTPDASGARSFYGSVFGWETLDVGGAEMWRLPGYGDHLEEATPGLRKRMKEMGAAEGFEDVVAALNPISDEQVGVPASWGVTFAVDDADATADKASQLGGKVVLAPVDGPWVRMTVIADPQGATFTASKFVPENSKLAVQAEPSVRAA